MDDIIAGLPTNSAQRIEIGKLKEQIAALVKENGELKEQLAKYAPKSSVSSESLKILQILFKNSGRLIIAQQFADMLNLEPGVAEYHCEKLYEERLVNRHRRAISGPVQHPDEYSLSTAGRAYLVENRLL